MEATITTSPTDVQVFGPPYCTPTDIPIQIQTQTMASEVGSKKPNS